MKMIDVSKVRVFRGSLFVLLMLFMRIGWASNDDSTYNIVDFGAKGDGITDNTHHLLLFSFPIRTFMVIAGLVQHLVGNEVFTGSI